MSVRTETADVVDHVPHLVGRQFTPVSAHAGIFHAVADDGEDLAVSGAVLPARAAQVSRPGIQFFSHLSVALPVIAMAARALAVLYLLASGERPRLVGVWVLQLVWPRRNWVKTTHRPDAHRPVEMGARPTPPLDLNPGVFCALEPKA